MSNSLPRRSLPAPSMKLLLLFKLCLYNSPMAEHLRLHVKLQACLPLGLRMFVLTTRGDALVFDDFLEASWRCLGAFLDFLRGQVSQGW